MYYIYKHTFPDGKVYIGATEQEPEKRWDNGKGYIGQQKIRNAILKYGWDNIRHDIVAEVSTKDEANAKETELIALYKSNEEDFGYNVAGGGNLYCTDNYLKVLDDGTILRGNQYAVNIHHNNKDDNESLMAASCVLKESGLKLYIYFYCQEDGKQIPIMTKNIIESVGMCKKAFYKAREELIDKGYLRKDKSQYANVYDFYAYPQTISD